MRADLDIDGRGFYQITANTAAGEAFLAAVQGADHGVAYCDDSRLTQDIADGACSEGLSVEVNGVAYVGAQEVHQ